MGNTKAHQIYSLRSGEAVVGVTTVLSLIAKPFLIHWAWQLGMNQQDYRKVRDQAGDVGTIAHLIIMHELNNTQPDLSEYSPNDVKTAGNCLLSFHEWRKSHEIKPILVEKQMVSERFAYGGTLDCLAYVNGELELLDFKTSKAIYSENFIQLAAYRQLLSENGYAPVNRARILRIGKDDNEGFEDRLITKFENEWQYFNHLLAIYYLQKSMGR